MAAGFWLRLSPYLRGPLSCLGVLSVSFCLARLLFLLIPFLKCLPLGIGVRLIPLCLPSLGNVLRPIAEDAAQTVAEELAPARRISTTLADARKPIAYPAR